MYSSLQKSGKPQLIYHVFPASVGPSSWFKCSKLIVVFHCHLCCKISAICSNHLTWCFILLQSVQACSWESHSLRLTKLQQICTSLLQCVVLVLSRVWFTTLFALCITWKMKKPQGCTVQVHLALTCTHTVILCLLVSHATSCLTGWLTMWKFNNWL